MCPKQSQKKTSVYIFDNLTEGKFLKDNGFLWHVSYSAVDHTWFSRSIEFSFSPYLGNRKESDKSMTQKNAFIKEMFGCQKIDITKIENSPVVEVWWLLG